MQIAVIGGGIAGLAASARLAHDGHEVVLLEKNAAIGGKIATVQKDGFTWDGGPSFFTDPEELVRLFNDCGKNINDYFKWFEMEEACRYFYEDGVLHGYDTPEKLAGELLKVFDEPREHTLKFLDDIAKLYDSAGQQFLNRPVDAKSFLSTQTLRSLRHLPRHSLYSSLHDMHTRYFTNPRTVQFFDRFATYVGGNPYRTPGMLMAMPHLEHNQGAVQPVGGMRAIVASAAKLAKDLGVDIRLGEEVKEVETEKNRIVSLRTTKNIYRPDAVVNAGDIAHFYELTNHPSLVSHVKKEHSLSGYVMYLGVRGETEGLYVHNILFSEDYEAETTALWNAGVYEDPTIYINNTSYYEKADAPDDCENWFVMVNVPAGFPEEKLPKVRSAVMKKLEQYFPGIEQRIITEAASLSPRFMRDTYHAYKGSIYGIAANSIRGAFLRPQNKDTKFNNVYHVGVTVHPGGGIPLALRSAKIVSKMLQ